MLISFTVQNYRSFGEEQTLDMVACKRFSDHPNHHVAIGDSGQSVLRSAVIYGGNGAGKSNLVRAMAQAVQVIKGGDGWRYGLVSPFGFGDTFAEQPSKFEFQFFIDNQVYAYGFDIERRKILNEWLVLVRGSTEDVIFERDHSGKVTRAPGSIRGGIVDNQTLSVLETLGEIPLAEHQLVLNRVIDIPESSQGTALRSVLKWLTSSLIILRPTHREPEIVHRLHTDEQFRELTSQFLQKVGTGIERLDIYVEERVATEFDRYRIREGLSRQSQIYDDFGYNDVRPKAGEPDKVLDHYLMSIHENSRRGWLFFNQESDGTQQLLHFMPVLAALRQDETRVVVIDELDRSLHPLVCWEFLRFFSETAPGAHKQLIVTTHEAHLLNQELLRRDEYWFVEKDEKQQSRLVSLADFKIRNDLQIEKGYLQGRFGAIPVIGSMQDVEKLLSSPEAEPANASQTPSA